MFIQEPPTQHSRSAMRKLLPWRRHLSQRAVGAAAAAILVGGASVWSAPSALAHDAVIASNPVDGAVLKEFPRSVELKFSGEPRENFNTLAISDSDKSEVLFTGEPKIDGNKVSLDLPNDLQPGDGHYIIGFQITSSDGHSTRGKTSFTVGNPQSPSESDNSESAQSSATENANDSSGVPAWALGLGIGLILLIAVVVLLINRKDQ